MARDYLKAEVQKLEEEEAARETEENQHEDEEVNDTDDEEDDSECSGVYIPDKRCGCCCVDNLFY